MVATPRCGVTGRVQRTESRYPLLCLRSVAPLNAARSSQRDDPTLKLQTVPPPILLRSSEGASCQSPDTRLAEPSALRPAAQRGPHREFVAPECPPTERGRGRRSAASLPRVRVSCALAERQTTRTTTCPKRHNWPRR